MDTNTKKVLLEMHKYFVKKGNFILSQKLLQNLIGIRNDCVTINSVLGFSRVIYPTRLMK